MNRKLCYLRAAAALLLLPVLLWFAPAWALDDGGSGSGSSPEAGTLSQGQYQFSSTVIVVHADGGSSSGSRIILYPEALPPSYTKASFDRLAEEQGGADGGDDYAGDHLEVSWDPAINAPLVKSVVLRPGRWQISFFAQPRQHPSDPYADTSWSHFGFAAQEVSIEKMLGNYTLACAYRRVAPSSQGPDLSKECTPTASPGWVATRIWSKREDLLTSDQLMARFGQRGESSTPLPTSSRSFEEEAARTSAEFLQAVADVALERVELAALEDVRKQVITLLCGREMRAQMVRAIDLLGNSLPRDQAMLPRTCAALERVRIEELATASSGLQNALKQDVAWLSTLLMEHTLKQCFKQGSSECPAILSEHPQLAAAIGGVGLLMHLAIEPEASATSLAQAQLVVKQVVETLRKQASSFKGQLPSQGNESLMVALTLTGAGIAYCHAHGPCDSHTLRRFLDEPKDFINASGLKPGDSLDTFLKQEEYIALKGRLLSILTHAQLVMSPESRNDSRRAALEASALVFEILELVLDARCQGGNCDRARRELAQFRDISAAVLRQDLPVALVAAGGVVLLRLYNKEDQQQWQRRLRYVNALTSYLNSYPSFSSLGAQGTALSLEEQRRIRRQAIHALINLASDKTQRVGEWTVSIAVTPGIRPFWSRDTGNGFEHLGVQLALPLGVDAERIIDERWSLVGRAILLDLGQYTAFSFGSKRTTQLEDPLTAIALGAGIGVQFKNWTIMVDGRYSPGWSMRQSVAPSEDSGSQPTEAPASPIPNSVSFGLTFGYQVPLLRIH